MSRRAILRAVGVRSPASTSVVSAGAGHHPTVVTAFSRTGDRRWRIETESVVETVVAGADLVYAATDERLVSRERP
jgi:hypothetical protein